MTERNSKEVVMDLDTLRLTALDLELDWAQRESALLPQRVTTSWGGLAPSALVNQAWSLEAPVRAKL